MPFQVLIVDDEPAVRESLRMVLEYEGYQVSEAATGKEGLRMAREDHPDLVLLDVRMPQVDGLDVLRGLREEGGDVPVIVMSGHGTIATAVEATKLGAFDFIEKPLGRERIVVAARNALRQRRLERRLESLEGRRATLLGASPAIEAVREAVRRAAPTSATVLITGESGTGKELVALAIHAASPRAGREFVRVNCAAIPEELIESELFGHEKGAFTGAIRAQKGKFLQADGGTIFLDEVGDMSLRTQAKVLRALQEHEIEPVGAGRSMRVDVRVVAATNKDLDSEILAGRFREDLFFRLNVIPIRVPALRERTEDIALLARAFIELWCAESGRWPPEITGGAEAALRAHPWRGNVRELRNTIERLLILGQGTVLDAPAVGAMLAGGQEPALQAASAEAAPAATLKGFRTHAERDFLIRKLRENGWNVAATARAVGTPRSNLYKKLEAYGIRREEAGRE